MQRITYSAKFYIIDFIIYIFVLSFSILALFILDKSFHWLVWGFYGVFAVISLFCCFRSLCNIQWIKVDSNSIYVHNIFGIIKKTDLSEIRSIKIVNACAWGMKMYSKYYSCVVISSRKKINPADIEDAYNHRGCYYIIFPNTHDNLKILRESYEKTSGKELGI